MLHMTIVESSRQQAMLYEVHSNNVFLLKLLTKNKLHLKTRGLFRVAIHAVAGKAASVHIDGSIQHAQQCE